MTLGEKISTERKNRGLSQESLSEISGISLRTIQRIENNKAKPRPYTLKVIADTLKLVIEELTPDQSRDFDTSLVSNSLTKINLINSSALLGVLIPLLNIVVPVVYWILNRNDSLVNEKGKKVISFQILWFLFSLLVLLITHFLHYIIAGQFITGRLPLVVVVYVLLLLVNVIFIIKNSIRLKKEDTEIYSFIPKLF